jgi:tetratricopeptide (TPR) repeat protein
MNWKSYPYPYPYPEAALAWRYEGEALRAHWARLHAGDAEPYPVKSALQDAWRAFHGGDFHRAMKLGLAQGVDGYCVAHKATCVYANDVETELAKQLELYEVVAERCERHQREQPDNPAAWYWQAYALGRYAQRISVVKALAHGLAPKVRLALQKTIALAPAHADAWIGLGVYHAEIVGTTGPLIASVSYGARKEDCQAAFRRAIEINPAAPSAYTELANARLRFGGKQCIDEVRALYRQAAALEAADAREQLEIERAKRLLEV